MDAHYPPFIRNGASSYMASACEAKHEKGSILTQVANCYAGDEHQCKRLYAKGCLPLLRRGESGGLGACPEEKVFELRFQKRWKCSFALSSFEYEVHGEYPDCTEY